MKKSKKYKINFDQLSKYIFVISIGISMFGYGFISSQNKLFPFHIIVHGYNQFNKLISDFTPSHIFKIRYSDSGVKNYIPNKVMPGTTLLSSFWPETEWTCGIRLIDSDNNTLHHWEVKANDIWPQSPHNDIDNNTKNTNENYVHGVYLYPNGDIVFNVEFMGLVKMNAEGDVLWKLPYRTHHSVFRDEHDNLWVAGAKWVEEGNNRIKLFPGLEFPFIEDTILKISPEGKILNEISLLEALYNGNYQHLLYHYNSRKGDILHLNDVEVLNSRLAKDFPLFDDGDILVSLRSLSLIAVLDQKGVIKWTSSGVFTNQHDPDFEEDGWITVFDNRPGLGNSMIKKINPQNSKVKTLYPVNPDQAFFSGHAGKHQKLNNGNRLIVEADAGRVFEISPEGETVWEWIQQPFDKKNVPEVLEGTRSKIGESETTKWSVAISSRYPEIMDNHCILILTEEESNGQ